MELFFCFLGWLFCREAFLQVKLPFFAGLALLSYISLYFSSFITSFQLFHGPLTASLDYYHSLTVLEHLKETAGEQEDGLRENLDMLIIKK